MHTETEEYIDDELLDERAEEESSPERDERQFEYEEHDIEAEEHEEIEPGTQAVLEQKGGEAEDWELAYRGDSGYRFDGEYIRDPDGNVWMNDDRELHEEMLAQWKEGGESVFFLPDYRESGDGVDILYVTQLILGDNGRVTYEIHKHETYRAEDEMNVPIEEAESHAELLCEEYETNEYSDTDSREEEISMDVLEAHEHIEIAQSENFDVPLHAAADEISKETGRAPEIAQETGTDEHPTREAIANEHVGCVQPDAWLIELLAVPHAERDQHAGARTNPNEHAEATARPRIEVMHEHAENKTRSEPVIPRNLESPKPAKNAAESFDGIRRIYVPIETHMAPAYAHVENVTSRARESQTYEHEKRETPHARTETRSEAHESIALLRTESNQAKTASHEARARERDEREQAQSADANCLPDAPERERAAETAPTLFWEPPKIQSERTRSETILRALGMARAMHEAERGYAIPSAGHGTAALHDDRAESTHSGKDRKHRLSMSGISMEITA